MKRLLLVAFLFAAFLVGIGTAIYRTADFERPIRPESADAAMRVAKVEPPVHLNMDSAILRDPDFEPPVRLTAGDAAVRVESPGYAAPCWADIHGDGQPHLLVGQFRKGKIRVFQHLHAEEFAAGEWLQASGNVAEVPGVW